MYEAKEQAVIQANMEEAKTKPSNAAMWALPVLGVIGMFVGAALITTRARRATRSTRRVHLVEPVQGAPSAFDDAPLLTEDDAVLE
jgi:hypothetical protein